MRLRLTPVAHTKHSTALARSAANGCECSPGKSRPSGSGPLRTRPTCRTVAAIPLPAPGDRSVAPARGRSDPRAATFTCWSLHPRVDPESVQAARIRALDDHVDLITGGASGSNHDELGHARRLLPAQSATASGYQAPCRGSRKGRRNGSCGSSSSASVRDAAVSASSGFGNWRAYCSDTAAMLRASSPTRSRMSSVT